MAKPRKDQDEKELEKLAKKLLSMPQKPREEMTTGQRKVDIGRSTRQKNQGEMPGGQRLGHKAKKK